MAHQGVNQSIIRCCLFVHFRSFPAFTGHVLLKTQHCLKRKGAGTLFFFPSSFQVHCICPWKSLSRFYQFLPAAHIIKCHSLATIIISYYIYSSANAIEWCPCQNLLISFSLLYTTEYWNQMLSQIAFLCN